ncbi:MAG: WD40 repeat domain-containing protein [Methylocystis sp.]|nr:WD40 repeat domain-containing protein [Methylocystis sp.]MBI3275931.1 WD40 repeat domain-containing protein [Methylocystis sp.]
MSSSFSLTSAVAAIDAGEGVVGAAFLDCTPVLALADGHVLLAEIGMERHEQRIRAHDGVILVAASDGRKLFTGGDDGRVVATDANGTSEVIADERGKWIDAVTIRADGAMAWSAGREVRARSPKGEVKSLALPSSSRGLAFAPKGYRLVIAHYNGVTLWFPNAAAKPETLEWKGSHLDVTASPDGRFVITSMQENMLHGWRLADGKHMRMAGYPGKTRSFAWSPDGKWLATSGADACVLWPFQAKDGPMGQAPRECGARADVKVARVAFHPSALVVALGYEDGMALLCRIADGSEILVRRPDDVQPKARISALAWDRDGGRLLFGAENGAAGLLTLPA